MFQKVVLAALAALALGTSAASADQFFYRHRMTEAVTGTPAAPTSPEEHRKNLTLRSTSGWEWKCKAGQSEDGWESSFVGNWFYPQATVTYEDSDGGRARDVFELYLSGFRVLVPGTPGTYAVRPSELSDAMCSDIPVVTAYGSGKDAWERIATATLDDTPIPAPSPWPALPPLKSPVLTVTLDNGWSFEYGGPAGEGGWYEADHPQFVAYRAEAESFIGADVYFRSDAWNDGLGNFFQGYVYKDGRANRPNPIYGGGFHGIIHMPADASSEHYYVALNGIAPQGGITPYGGPRGPYDNIESRGSYATGWHKIIGVSYQLVDPF